MENAASIITGEGGAIFNMDENLLKQYPGGRYASKGLIYGLDAKEFQPYAGK